MYAIYNGASSLQAVIDFVRNSTIGQIVGPTVFDFVLRLLPIEYVQKWLNLLTSFGLEVLNMWYKGKKIPEKIEKQKIIIHYKG